MRPVYLVPPTQGTVCCVVQVAIVGHVAQGRRVFLQQRSDFVKLSELSEAQQHGTRHNTHPSQKLPGHFPLATSGTPSVHLCTRDSLSERPSVDRPGPSSLHSETTTPERRNKEESITCPPSPAFPPVPSLPSRSRAPSLNPGVHSRSREKGGGRVSQVKPYRSPSGETVREGGSSAVCSRTCVIEFWSVRVRFVLSSIDKIHQGPCPFLIDSLSFTRFLCYGGLVCPSSSLASIVRLALFFHHLRPPGVATKFPVHEPLPPRLIIGPGTNLSRDYEYDDGGRRRRRRRQPRNRNA